jgi:hypothetical protein
VDLLKSFYAKARTLAAEKYPSPNRRDRLKSPYAKAPAQEVTDLQPAGLAPVPLSSLAGGREGPFAQGDGPAEVVLRQSTHAGGREGPLAHREGPVEVALRQGASAGCDGPVGLAQCGGPAEVLSHKIHSYSDQVCFAIYSQVKIIPNKCKIHVFNRCSYNELDFLEPTAADVS